MNPEDVAAMHEDLEWLQRPTPALLGGADTIDYTPNDSDEPLGHEDTIATVSIDGRRYEIYWPPDVEDPDQRSPWLAPDREEEL